MDFYGQISYSIFNGYFHGLVQDCVTVIAYAAEITQSCTKPQIWQQLETILHVLHCKYVKWAGTKFEISSNNRIMSVLISLPAYYYGMFIWYAWWI